MKKGQASVQRDEDVPAAMVDLAKRRVRPFIAVAATYDAVTLLELCASCYVQGLRDAQDATSEANKT